MAYNAHTILCEGWIGEGAFLKLLILTQVRRGLASEFLKIIHDSANCQVVAVVLSRGLVASPWKRRRRKLRKIGRIGLLGALNGIRLRSWYEVKGGDDLQSICYRHQIPFFEISCTNSDAAERLFKQAHPDLGVSLGNNYISERIYSIPRFGMINFHGEILPKYQNAQGVIWPIYDGETKTGFTIHRVNNGIDTGDIIYQETFPILFKPSLKDTVLATNEITRSKAPAALRYVCEHFERLAKESRAQLEISQPYTTPSYLQFVRMKRNNRLLYPRFLEDTAQIQSSES